MPNKHLVYEEPKPVSRLLVRQILSGGTSEEIQRVLVSLAFHEDFDFALEHVLSCARSHEASIRGTAILCLGHVARIHGRLPAEPTIEIIQAGLRDANPYVRGQAENAADDLEVFVPAVGQLICGR